MGDEVYEAFEQAAFPMDKIAAQYPNAALKANAEERERMAREGNVEQPLKWHIDLPKCNEMILKHIGVPEENIQIAVSVLMLIVTSISLQENSASSRAESIQES